MTGDSGTTIVQYESNGSCYALRELDPRLKASLITCNRDNDVILQDHPTNDLILFNRNLEEQRRLSGIFEGPLTRSGKIFFVNRLEIKETNFRHSLDNRLLLWRQGKNMMSIVDRKSFLIVNSISDFFKYKSVSTKPIAACANKKSSVIVAISQHPTNDRNLIHFYESADGVERIRVKYLTRAFPEIRKAYTIESSLDGKVGYIGGIHKQSGKPMILSFEMTKGMNLISYIILDELDFGKPRIMKRIKGHDILIIGCNYHYCMVTFKNYKFYMLGKLRDVHKSRVLDFQFRNNTLFSKGQSHSNRSMSMGSGSVNSSISHSPSFSQISQTPTKIKTEISDKTKDAQSRAARTEKSLPQDSRYFTNKKEKSRAPSVAYNSAVGKGGPRPQQGLMLSGPKNSQITVKGVKNIEKVAISYEGKRIYVGGMGLHIIQKTSGQEYSSFSKKNLKNLNFFSIKSTNSKHVVLQLEGTNDLLILDKLGNEVTSIKGGEPFSFRKFF